ncbi:hypothetical protein F2P81_009271 [Scophthalmus maximus]|uniref:Uncharacterized protein n=1 Tax=Scophthalmus maximus TaxID=52904 RepID=A0A6A4SYR4_SCOMX|nr:hypothetical protein F2P81_009271 [Scophthalmus maximus]
MNVYEQKMFSVLTEHTWKHATLTRANKTSREYHGTERLDFTPPRLKKGSVENCLRQMIMQTSGLSTIINFCGLSSDRELIDSNQNSIDRTNAHGVIDHEQEKRLV